MKSTYKAIKPPPLDAQWAKKANNTAHGRCSSKKIPYDLTAIWLLELMRTQKHKCFYCFTPFSFSNTPRRTSMANKPTLDRVDPRDDVGYVKTNVVIACHACNNLKADGQLQEFERLVRGIRKHRKLIEGAGLIKEK